MSHPAPLTRRVRRTLAATCLSSAIGAGMIATPAMAKDGDVVGEGGCSASSDWKLKLSEEDGRLEVEYEVDQNRSGDTWSVRLSRNGDRIFTGTRQTAGRSGSFEVRRVIADANVVSDRVTARAVNQRTGEVCGGLATSNF